MSIHTSTIQSDSPLAWWRLGELAGSTAADSSGNGYDAAYGTGHTPGGMNAIAGDNDPSVILPGSSTATLSVPYDAAFDLQQLSLEAWVYLRSSGANTDGFIEKTVGGHVNTQYLLFADSSLFQFRLFSSDATAYSAVLRNQWVHVVGTYDGTIMCLYINGALAFSTPSPGAVNTGAGPVVLGGLGDGVYPLYGWLDEAAIYNRALPASRVLAHYNAGIVQGRAAKVVGGE